MLHLLLLTYPGEFKGNVKKWQRESKKNFDSFLKLANHVPRAGRPRRAVPPEGGPREVHAEGIVSVRAKLVQVTNQDTHLCGRGRLARRPRFTMM